MDFVNSIGLLQGTDVSGFLLQFWGLILDLLFIGLERAADILGNPSSPNEIFSFESEETEGQHPLKMYCRHLDKFHAIFHFQKEEAEEMVDLFL